MFAIFFKLNNFPFILNDFFFRISKRTFSNLTQYYFYFVSEIISDEKFVLRKFM